MKSYVIFYTFDMLNIMSRAISASDAFEAHEIFNEKMNLQGTNYILIGVFEKIM